MTAATAPASACSTRASAIWPPKNSAPTSTSTPTARNAVNARYSLAVCLTRLGKHAEAAKELAVVTAAKDFAFAPDAILLLAQCAVAEGDDATAVRVLEPLAERYPTFAQLDRASVMLGESLYRLGKFSDAKDKLAEVSAKWPKSPVADRAELFAAMAQVADGDIKSAADRAARLRAKAPQGEYAANAALIEGQCRQQLKDLPNAAITLRHSMTKRRPRPAPKPSLGLARRLPRWGAISPAPEQAASPTPQRAPPPMISTHQPPDGKGAELSSRKATPPEALPTFAEARKADSDTVKAEAAYWFAKCQIKQGKYNEAAANLDHAAELFPKSDLLPDILYERAAAISKSGDDAAALEALGSVADPFLPAERPRPRRPRAAQAWCAPSPQRARSTSARNSANSWCRATPRRLPLKASSSSSPKIHSPPRMG